MLSIFETGPNFKSEVDFNGDELFVGDSGCVDDMADHTRRGVYRCKNIFVAFVQYETFNMRHISKKNIPYHFCFQPLKYF